jgi:hypothetical protein
MAIDPGTRVEVTTALGERVVMRALRGPEPGQNFEVIWVATESDYAAAIQAGQEPDVLPWPSEHVRVLESSETALGLRLRR